MWKRISTAISILCIAFYGAALFFAVSQIINAAGEHRIIADREFAGLQEMIRGAGALGFSGSDLEKEIRASVLRSLSLEAVIVTAPGSAFAVEKPGRRAIITGYDGVPYSFNTKSRQYRTPYSAQINANAQTTLTVTALAAHIDKARLGDILRRALLIVLLSVTAAFLILMLDILLFDRRKGGRTAPSVSPAPVPQEKSVPPLSAPSYPVPPAPPSLSMDDLPRILEKAPEKPAQPVFDTGADEAEAGGLPYLAQKLDEEIALSSGEDSDFALVCAKWTSGASDSANRFMEEAAGFFHVDRTAAFKKSGDSVFILLPDTTFKSGLKTAREFHSYILDSPLLKTVFTNLCIGLTTCAGRAVAPERLILEAEKAAEKAATDPAQPIVAFKADPSKYKDYLKRKK
jgi:hypothetical protein